jgi:hypothetical protein
VRQRLCAHRVVDVLQVQHNPQSCIYAAGLFEAEITPGRICKAIPDAPG